MNNIIGLLLLSFFIYSQSFADESLKFGTTDDGDHCSVEVVYGNGSILIKAAEENGDYLSEYVMFKTTEDTLDLIKEEIAQGELSLTIPMNNNHTWMSDRGSIKLDFYSDAKIKRIDWEHWQVGNGPIFVPEFIGKLLNYKSIQCNF